MESIKLDRRQFLRVSGASALMLSLNLELLHPADRPRRGGGGEKGMTGVTVPTHSMS